MKRVFLKCNNCGEQGCVDTENSILGLSAALDVSDIWIEVEDLEPIQEGAYEN